MKIFEFLDYLHQPAIVLEPTTGIINLTNRAFASAVGLTSRQILRNYKTIEDLFPASFHTIVDCLKEALNTGRDANSEEVLELINSRYFVFICRAILVDENKMVLLLSDLTVEKKLQEKYSILQRSLSAYTQRMKNDLEFKDYIVDRLPKLLTFEIGQASKNLLILKEQSSKKDDQLGLRKVRYIAAALDQVSYISKNISQLRSPYKVEKFKLPLSEVANHLRVFFRRSFDSEINSIVVKLPVSYELEPTFVDLNLLSFALRNLFAFLHNKAAGQEKVTTVFLKPVVMEQKSLLEISGTVERLGVKSEEVGVARDLGLELLVANKLIKALGGHLRFSSASMLSFELTLPSTTDFALYRKKPVHSKVWFYGARSSLPSGLLEFFESENLSLNLTHQLDQLGETSSEVVIVASGILTKTLVEKLSKFNDTNVSIVPVIRPDTYDQLLYAMEELTIPAFLLEPLTIDNLRSVFFDESENEGFVIRPKA